jgi:hypothetical protein
MSKCRDGSLPRVVPKSELSGLDVRIPIPGLPIVAPEPLAVSLGGSETAGLQFSAELARQGRRVTVACNTAEPLRGGVCNCRAFRRERAVRPFPRPTRPRLAAPPRRSGLRSRPGQHVATPAGAGQGSRMMGGGMPPLP